MTLDVDALMDRRRLKRQVAIWRVLAIVLAVAALVAIGGRIAAKSSDYVARITISGVIAEDKARDKLLDDAAADDKVKAVIVAINSPGGTVVGAERIYARLRKIAAKKPVVATMGTLATSAGYYIAVGTDRIFAHEGSITASIGVIFQATDITALMEKLGVKIDMIKSGSVKASPNPFEKTSPEARAVIDALVKDTFDQFLTLVRTRRKLSDEQAKTIADGRVVTGRQARALGLVDELGGDDAALAWLQREKKIDTGLKIRDVKPKESFDWGDLVGQTIGLRRDLTDRLALDGLISLWHPALR
ncbi:MAG: signal peptide peptidase SppA [Rhodospirillaceae bacterium]|nr:signal peptide peptidase SppA [Rhodospirillaceae bacterium]